MVAAAQGDFGAPTAWLIGGGLAVLLVVCVPWNRQVRAPGWMHAEVQYTLYSPLSARLLKRLPTQQGVAAGAVLFVLDAPEIRNKAERAARAAEAYRAQLDGLAGNAPGGKSAPRSRLSSVASRPSPTHRTPNFNA